MISNRKPIRNTVLSPQGSNPWYYLLLFLIWPFLAFIIALFNYRTKEARKIVYFFIVYYGFTFYNNNEYIDAYRYVLNLERNALRPFSEVFNIIGGLYSDTTVDVVEPIISFVVSRFTTFAGAYFAVWTALLGFFYLKSINIFHDKYIKQPGFNSMIMMAFFTFILPVTAVSGIRMPTATMIFFYGACMVVLNRDKRFFILTLAATFVHWSFITANALLFVYIVLGNRNIIYYPLVILSFTVPHLAGPLLSSISLGLGGAMQSRYEGYSSEGYIRGMQEASESASWFVGLSEDLVFYYLLILIFIIQIAFKLYPKQREDLNLFSFLLLFLSFVNFGKIIPTFGGRFQTVFLMFAALYVFLNFVKRPGWKNSWLTIIGIFPMLLYSLVHFRIGSETINAWLITPIFGSPLIAPGLSLAELLF